MPTAEAALPSGLRKVPPFPPIASQLLSLLSDPGVETKDIAKLIGSDAILTARLLQCVNSAGFGLQQLVGNVHHAVALMGIDRTREVTMTLAMAAYAKGALRTEELRRCWRHTVATAVLAEEIAHSCEAFTEVAFTAGIMHDIGRLGLLVAYPERYERTIRHAAEQCLDLLDFEREEFGFDHAETGRLLSEHWGLPNDFCVVAGRHHDPLDGTEVDLLRIVHTACRLADALGYDVTCPLVPLQAVAVLAELPLKVRQRIATSEDELRARVERRILEFDSGKSNSPPETAMVVSAPASEEQSIIAPELPQAEEPQLAFPPLTLGQRIIVACFALLAGIGAFLLFRMR